MKHIIAKLSLVVTCLSLAIPALAGGGPSAFVLSLSGNRIATTEEHSVTISEVTRQHKVGKTIRRWSVSSTIVGAFASKDSKLIAIQGMTKDGAIVSIYRVKDGSTLGWAPPVGNPSTSAVAFSPNSRYVAAAVGRAVYVWDTTKKLSIAGNDDIGGTVLKLRIVGKNLVAETDMGSKSFMIDNLKEPLANKI